MPPHIPVTRYRLFPNANIQHKDTFVNSYRHNYISQQH